MYHYICSLQFPFYRSGCHNRTSIIIKNSSFLSKGQAAVYKVYYKFDIKNSLLFQITNFSFAVSYLKVRLLY